MSSHLTPALSQKTRVMPSAQLAAEIAAADFSGCAATIIGYGNMGSQYLKALRALGLRRIRVCSRSEGPLAELKNIDGVTPTAGGYSRFEGKALPGELAIVATPTADLIGATEHMAALGFRKIMIEKPVSLWPSQMQALADDMELQGVEAACAYNRVAYPSSIETRFRVEREGGITSCTYTFTEYVHRIGAGQFPEDELARWGIANSLHVISMAHGLIGLPDSWAGFRTGSIPWHPSGSVFVGSGTTVDGIPYSYHADWGSTGRWSVEVHSPIASYRLCPIERIFTRTSATGAWDEFPLATFDSKLKAGFAEQVAAMLIPKIREVIPLVSLRQAARLTEFAEQVFGYPSA